MKESYFKEIEKYGGIDDAKEFYLSDLVIPVSSGCRGCQSCQCSSSPCHNCSEKHNKGVKYYD